MNDKLPLDFDWRTYLAIHTDLTQNGISTQEQAETHYLNHGQIEGRKYIDHNKNNLPADFDWQLYLDMHIDLRNGGITTKQQAENHYIRYGIKEKRQYHVDDVLETLPANFDWRIYLLFNPDIAKLYPDKESAEKQYRFYGHKESRKFESILTYEKLVAFKNHQSFKSPDDNNYTVFVNHQSSLSGAPIFLQDLANYMANNSNSVIFIDCFPNEYYDLHPDIKIYYHFDDAVLLKHILDSISFIDYVYSNSESLILKNLDMFDDYLYKTIFHLHECKEEIRKQLDSTTLEQTIRKSNRFVFVAQQIINDQCFSDLSKVYHCPEFIAEPRALDILNSITTPKDRSNHKPLIGMCGTNCRRKNPTLFIDLAKKNPHYDFIWIGGNITQEKINNLTCISETKDPFKYLNKIDYLLLTSTRDPCPIVVLESMLMNKKIILLENNIKYKHNTALLENVHVITEHNNCADKISQQINKLNLNTIPNTTEKNQKYINDNFIGYPRYRFANQERRAYNLCLSYFHKDDREIQYYTDLINSRLILDPDLNNIYISVAALSDIDNVLKRFTDKISSDKLKITLRENAGFDIGGLIDILLSHDIDENEYITYIHNKSNLIWREHLFRILYASDYYKNDTTICREYYIECETADHNRQIMSKHKFMNDLSNESFNYISGTCFNTKMKNLIPLVKNGQYIKNNLTSLDTDDKFWQECMMNIDIFNEYYINNKDTILFNKIDEDARDVLISTNSKNLFELKQKYDRSGIPDFMFEHALERYIGYLITNNKKVNLV